MSAPSLRKKGGEKVFNGRVFRLGDKGDLRHRYRIESKGFFSWESQGKCLFGSFGIFLGDYMGVMY